jgi:hypothetical protein
MVDPPLGLKASASYSRDSRPGMPDVGRLPAPAAGTGTTPWVERVRCTRKRCGAHPRPCQCQFGWHAARFSCYHSDMRVMALSLSLLLLALAMMLPAVARADTRAEVPISALTAFLQSASPGQAKRMAMRCYRCFGKACSASAVACGASCGSASALAPLVVVLTSVISAETQPTSSKVARDHGIPPDPHPPRPIAIG